MDHLLSTPGMIVTTITVFGVQLVSLLLLWLNIHLFHRQAQKHKSLLKTLGNELAWGNAGMFLLPIYLVTTFVMTIVITYLFVFQPHLL